MTPTVAEIDAMVTAEVMAQVEEDAARFRWLLSNGSWSLHECWLAALQNHLNGRGAVTFPEELRAVIDRQRGTR